jgi:hypothetical protein
MTRPSRRHEPALIAAFALQARRASRDKRVMIDGMIHISPADTSPHDQAREIRDALIASFPPAWRAAISVTGPVGDAEYNIELKPPISEEAALAIGRAFERAFPGREITLNTWAPLAEAAGYPGMPWTPWSWPRQVPAELLKRLRGGS